MVTDVKTVYFHYTFDLPIFSVSSTGLTVSDVLQQVFSRGGFEQFVLNTAVNN